MCFIFVAYCNCSYNLNIFDKTIKYLEKEKKYKDNYNHTVVSFTDDDWEKLTKDKSDEEKDALYLYAQKIWQEYSDLLQETKYNFNLKQLTTLYEMETKK